MTAIWDSLWIDIDLATLQPGAPYGAIRDGALAVLDGRIAWVGPRTDLPGAPARLATQVIEGGRRWMTPGLIDCHTHILFGGERSREFELRLEGASYEELARAGGGIVSTVAATRAASEDDLVAGATRRLKPFLAEGVTTVEVKSGYGLDLASELKMLRAARRLAEHLPVQVRTSFLGAHAVPPEFKGRQADYVDLICDEMLPAIARSGLADAVDGFCENIAFGPAEMERIFATATTLGLRVKLHAEQLSDLGGAALAARFGALSADHLECLGQDGIAAMAAAGTVAVLLPGANYFLAETRRPPIAALRRAGVSMAIASNCNPGSAPVLSLLLMLSMACTLFRLTPEEALAGVTREAARALGLADRGILAPGRRADLALWDIESPGELAYWIGGNPCAAVVHGGKLVKSFS
ncbi:MAG TPA: imidazolonepropionase [Aliidongia sp.]|uniref:imidazolonepropionase n=1 Tax=Aliidongia sp. TaxID=1914230 RepID=UPI002DDDB15D|nr:imidazolonepropionase [Aliidongia sp.]HEV2676920.1 imidazolonepropionase [Aliidongia sp.]